MHPEQWKIVRKLLGWIVCAKRPLKWREIQAAVSIDTCRQMFDFHGRKLRSSVEEYCGSLIQVLSDDRIELVHATAKMYIRLLLHNYSLTKTKADTSGRANTFVNRSSNVV